MALKVACTKLIITEVYIPKHRAVHAKLNELQQFEILGSNIYENCVGARLWEKNSNGDSAVMVRICLKLLMQGI
jgi:hypothetical protein